MNEQPMWLRSYGRGIDKSWDWTVVYEGERYALIRIPGTHYWVGRGMDWGYAGVEYRVVRKDRNLLNDPEKIVHEGRLTATKRNELISRVDELDKLSA